MMTSSQITQLARRIGNDDEGVTLIEFAFLAPLMVLLIIGGSELAYLAQAHLRVSEIANTVADNASRVITATDETDVYEVFAGAEVMGEALNFEDNGRIVLSSLQENGETGPKAGQVIRWQRCWGDLDVDPKYGDQGDGAADDSMKDGMGPEANKIISTNGNPVIFAEVSYKYKPLFLNGILSEHNVRYESSFSMRDRANRTIANGQHLPVKNCS